MRLLYYSKQFDRHRCTQNPAWRSAHWFDSVGGALRMWPRLEPHIPADTPPSTSVFYCHDCDLIGLAPGKATK